MDRKTLKILAVLFAAAMLYLLYQPVKAQAPPASNGAYLYIASSGTTVVRGNGGYLHAVTINGGAVGTVTLYDIASSGCTGTPASGKFATIESLPATNSSPVTLFYDIQTKNGICVVTAAATDVTVSFN